jgi:hypothetical protein
VERLRAVMAALEAEEFALSRSRVDAPLAEDDADPAGAPDERISRRIEADLSGVRDSLPLDADTFMSPGSVKAAAPARRRSHRAGSRHGDGR